MMEKTFLPSIYGPTLPSSPCGLNSEAREFEYYWLKALGERASLMRCDSRLTAVAQKHAEWLALYHQPAVVSMHIGEGGSTANERVRAGGYRLPSWHREIGNTVESTSHNFDKIDIVVESLLDHEGHKEHLRGEGLFAPHTVYGIGARAAFYVILAVPPEEG